MSTDLTNAVTFLAYVVGAGLLWLAIAEVRAAWRQTRRANLDAAMRGGDHARVEQMLAAIAAEEAWGRDVWGGQR